MASALLSYWRTEDVFSEPSVIASELRSLNDFPDEILLKILSHFGPEDLCLIIAKVCERWNALAKDVILWKTLSYNCDRYSDFCRVAQVRCAALLRFRTN
jgi:F-box domain.